MYIVHPISGAALCHGVMCFLTCKQLMYTFACTCMYTCIDNKHMFGAVWFSNSISIVESTSMEYNTVQCRRCIHRLVHDCDHELLFLFSVIRGKRTIDTCTYKVLWSLLFTCFSEPGLWNVQLPISADDQKLSQNGVFLCSANAFTLFIFMYMYTCALYLSNVYVHVT